MKHKSNSLPKSAFSNIQLRVQEIRDQLEVLKQSSHVSGSKALQQVFPRMRPPSLTQGHDLSARPGFLNNRKFAVTFTLGQLVVIIYIGVTRLNAY